MAPSLQVLIDFLLNEVALCGSQGATLPEVLKFIEAFYRSVPKTANQREQTIDRRFQVKVWSWLTRNPEVSVGKHGEWNHLSLDDVELLDSKSQPAAEETAKDQDESPAVPASSIRIYVSNERTWLAIAGHEPDESKIPNAEWALLSVIASFKSDGIAQTELVRRSGQDKRSVPKRTDALEAKGYIEKRAVQVKSARTSLCTLRRFLKPATGTPSDQQHQKANKDRPMIDFDVFNKNLFEILKKYGIISRNDLKKELGFDDPWRWRILSRALRKFESIGVLKRVRAESQYERLHPCVMLLREPTDKDMEKFHEFTRLDLIRDDDGAGMEEDVDMDGTQKTGLVADEGAVIVKKEGNVVDAGRTVPSWTPDRNLSNQIFDVIDKSGTTGITNMNLNRICFGSYYRRPSESILHRLVDCWQLSQPLHLRHLAIVRDTAIEKTVFYYVHYSARNFAKLVDSGDAEWEAVECSAKAGKAQKVYIPPADAKPQIDQYGLPSGPPPQDLLKNGNASLFEGVAICRPSNYLLSSSDPFPVQRPDGSFTIQSGLVKNAIGMTAHSPIGIRRQGRPKGTLNRATLLKSEQDFAAPATPHDEILEPPPEAASSTPRTTQSRRPPMAGLSKKERFEAMGMDETWVEYKLLLMDRPSPGVYVTPKGRRRPAGKRQGRPRQSRIAVFKSNMLHRLPWFVRERSDSDEEMDTLDNAAASATFETPLATPLPSMTDPENHVARPTIEDTQISTRRPKRTQAPPDYTDSPTPAHGPIPQTSYRGRLSKKPRLDEGGPDLTVFVDSEDTSLDPMIQQAPAETASVARRDKGAAVHELEAENHQKTRPKRRRIDSPERARADEPLQVSTPVQITGPAVQPTEKPITPLPRDLSMQRTPSIDPGTPSGPNQRIPSTGDRGGSIGILRRKIIMEIVEKAGGAYPSGIEIWYPFATAWMKTNRKERPDMRTIKTAIKHLVDTGKLKQLTFSGRDSKGVMVTKTILAMPGMSPDDPLIRDMQQKVLATDRREPVISYSPHVEADPFVTRSGGTPTIQRFQLPVVAGTTVKLHEKPAAIRNEEKRKERKVQRALLKQLAAENGEMDESRHRGAKRLMKIHRPSAQDPLSGTHTSIMRPSWRPRGRPRAVIKAVSIAGATSMLMNPGQSYHGHTGTFGTGAKLGARKPRITAIKPPVGNIADHVEELARMARQAEDPSSRTDKILQWELGNERFFNANFENYPYIDQALNNHTFHAAPIEGKIRFDTDEPVRAPAPARPPMKTRTRRRHLPSAARPQPVGRRLDKVDTSLSARKDVKAEVPRQPLRRQRHVPPLPEHLHRKLMVAIVAVRVLAGGTEGKLCDWDLVAAAFPSEDSNYIQDRAKQVLNRNRLQILKMQRDFQERFIDAYAKDQVPKIDYNHLDKYNWPAVIEWAVIELDVSTSERAPSLPATREQFDSIFELREEPVATGDELYGTTSTISVVSKRNIMTRIPFAVPMEREQADRPGPRKTELARLDVTKTWVRANIVTPEQSYNPEEARQILHRFGEPLVDSAVKSLMTERVISMGNRGRVTPGRNYDITDHLLQQINRKRTIEYTILRSAAHFKTTVLDPRFQNQGACDLDYSADDGDILALINLAAAGRISLHPRDPPRDKFGLTEDGYQTRQMDKSRVRFAIEIRPRPSYVYGNPIQERSSSLAAPGPRPSTDPNLPPKIPLWYHIHGQLVPQIWDMAIASVVGCVAMRQGLSAQTISSMIKPALGTWEIELLLGWLAEVGAVTREGSDEHAGWKVKEWWWLVLP